jgi:hypothetical protein
MSTTTESAPLAISVSWKAPLGPIRRPTKAVIALNELSVLHSIILVPLGNTKKRDYVAINPNGRLLSIQDPNKESCRASLAPTSWILSYDAYDTDNEKLPTALERQVCDAGESCHRCSGGPLGHAAGGGRRGTLGSHPVLRRVGSEQVPGRAGSGCPHGYPRLSARRSNMGRY